MDVCRLETAAVVFYGDEEDIFVLAALYEDDAGAGVADGVAQQLLYYAVDCGLFGGDDRSADAVALKLNLKAGRLESDEPDLNVSFR